MKRTRKELLEQIEMLEKVCKENKDVATRALIQAKEWKALFDAVCTEDHTLNVSSEVH